MNKQNCDRNEYVCSLLSVRSLTGSPRCRQLSSSAASQNVVEYQDDNGDPTKFAANPNVTPSVTSRISAWSRSSETSWR